MGSLPQYAIPRPAAGRRLEVNRLQRTLRGRNKPVAWRPHETQPHVRIFTSLTLKESGADVGSDAWNALIGPAGMPPAIIAQINDEVRDALTRPSVRERLETQLIEATPSTPAGLRARMDAKIQLWADVIRRGNIRIN
ncbi:MAG TPA: tripartite tricarboxylate transporter substrate-binding protein [Afipia sp.]